MLTGFDDPAADASPLHTVHGFARQMLLYTTTFDGANRINGLPRGIRRNIRFAVLTSFNAILEGALW